MKARKRTGAKVPGKTMTSPAPSLRALLTDLIDYAGLFPPANLGMAEAVRNYQDYLSRNTAWMLGRFIVSASRLRELESELAGIGNASLWEVSCLVGEDAQAGLREIERFNHRNANARAIVDTIEVRSTSLDFIGGLSDKVTTYIEVLPDASRKQLQWMGEIGARAKIRTGGVIPEAIPSSAAIAGFLVNCAAAGAGFKATAGLHHPVRSSRALTYELGAPRATLHGFLNLFLAAALARRRASAVDLAAVLDLEETEGLHFGDDGAQWGDLVLTAEAIRETREQFAISFGSCSFEEPVEDLKELHLL